MKKQKLQRIGIIFLSLVFVPAAVAYAGVFDNDEENWRRIFRDIKKINSRLVTLETGKMKVLENSQQDLFRQIDEIKSLIPSLQGAVEQSQSEVVGRFEATIRKLADIEKQIKLDLVKNVNQELSKIDREVTSQLNQQTIANGKFQANLATQFDQLKSHMAGDMDKIANLNKGSFQELVQSNNQSFAKVVEQLKAQRQNLDSYKEVIKSDLIPTIVQQNEKNGAQLLASMSQANKENKETLLAGLADIGAKNQKLVEVLQMSLKEGEATRGNVERLSLNVDASNNNVIKLKDALVLQLDSILKAQQALVTQVGTGSSQIDQKVEGVHQNLIVAGEKINKLAESLKGIQAQTHSSATHVASLQQNLEQIKGDNALSGEKINKLISSSTELAAHSNAMSQSLQSIEGGLAGVEASNQKLTKLIDILKVMASEQGKLTQIMAGQGDIKQSQKQILQTQAELSKAQAEMGKSAKANSQLSQSQAQILKAQQELRQAQSQILKAQEKIINAQRQALKDQAEAKKTLAELSRKANVNISRNDAIRKTLSNISKNPSSPR